jgi:predicted nucleotidyltransferase
MTSALKDVKAPFSMEAVEAFCRKFGVDQLALFGSVVREDFGPQSDVDVILRFKSGYGFTFENTPDIQDALESIFGRNVDVIELEQIRNPIRRQAILNSHRVIYAS